MRSESVWSVRKGREAVLQAPLKHWGGGAWPGTPRNTQAAYFLLPVCSWAWLVGSVHQVEEATLKPDGLGCFPL